MNVKTKILTTAGWGLLASVAVAFFVFVKWDMDHRSRNAIRADNGCLAAGRPQQVLAVVDDPSDSFLTSDQPRRWQDAVDGQVAALRPAARVVFSRVAATAPAEAIFGPDLCAPPPEGGARSRTLRAQFAAEIDKVKAGLSSSKASPSSAISATILVVASDTKVRRLVDRRILINSDLLEFDPDGANAYKRPFQLPATEGKPLIGVQVHFNVLRNMEAGTHQDRALIQAWIDWAKAAGATEVTVDAPWLGFIPPAMHPTETEVP